MPVTTSTTATEIINRVAVEVGLDPIVGDPFSSQDSAVKQLTFLINSAGEELCLSHDWGFLVKEAAINTDLDDSGEYPLPDDFFYITNQTCWEQNNRVPVTLLSAQDCQYL